MNCVLRSISSNHSKIGQDVSNLYGGMSFNYMAGCLNDMAGLFDNNAAKCLILTWWDV